MAGDFAPLIEARADLIHALVEFLEALHDTNGAAVSQRGDDLEDATERAVDEWRRSPHADASRPRPVP
jgi:hypothetical protein